MYKKTINKLFKLKLKLNYEFFAENFNRNIANLLNTAKGRKS